LAGPENEHGKREEPDQPSSADTSALDKVLERLKAPVGATRGSSCPDEDVWIHVAAGIPAFSDARDLLAHSVECDYCAGLLAKAADEQSANPTEEEHRQIDRIGLEGPRQIFAAEAAKFQPSKPVAAPARWRPWAYAAAAILAVAPVTWWAVNKSHSDDPSTLLATAYTQHRTLELRFPGAKYAPLQQTRGRISATEQPASRTQALLIIQQQLSANPEQAGALTAKGRLELLDWNYKDAIASFTRALELQPDSEPLLVDLAGAYFERASTENSALDYGRAFEYIEKALARNPKDPVALYNRALIAEHMQTYEEAIASWQRFLQVEPSSDWSAEARQHLLDLEQKKKSSEDNRRR